jgi:CSLREA domain-containing protein
MLRSLNSLRLIRQLLTVSAFALLLSASLSLVKAWNNGTPQEGAKQERVDLASLDDRAGVRPDHSNPHINLTDGREVVTTYSGAESARQALEMNQASALSLASADFDEDGAHDLVSGYSTRTGGIITLHSGNVDAIYPNAPEAQQRRASGRFTEAPFLSPARVYEVAASPDFIGAGDFDADGHRDVVVARRGASALYLLLGDGRGGFGKSIEISLPGVVTALAVGEVNRADGLDDVAVGVQSKQGAQALVFEGPEGALRAAPESFSMPSKVTALALGQLNGKYTYDLAVAAGHNLLVIGGRDRKLSLDEESRREVKAAAIGRRTLAESIRSISIGDFAGDGHHDLAVLTQSGAVQLLRQETGRPFTQWQRETVSGSWAGATRLFTAQVSSQPGDDLLVMDGTSRQMRILSQEGVEQSVAVDGEILKPGARAIHQPMREQETLAVEGEPVAVLGARLNPDALSDLVIARSGSSAPAVVTTTAGNIYTVNSKADTTDGACNATNCTLREAINAANADAVADEIRFNIPGNAPYTINLAGELFSRQPVVIDGTTQPGYAGKPIVELRFSNDNSNLKVIGGNSVIRGLIVNSATDSAIHIAAKGNNRVEGSYIGTNANGTAPINANTTGMTIVIGSANVIGGTTSAARNIIAGAGSGYGVLIFGDSNSNVVQGNYIGTDPTGTINVSPDNQRIGVDVRTFNNTIGGTTAGARNVIAGGQVGVSLFGVSQISGNLIQGNHIGTNVNGTAALGCRYGVDNIGIVSGNTIGGTVPTARNLISGNKAGAIFLGDDAKETLVQGNYIGTNVWGSGALGNGEPGYLIGSVIIQGDRNTIGGATTGARNVISGGKADGIQIIGFPAADNPDAANGNQVQGNFIGTNAAGTARVGNARDGVLVTVHPDATNVTNKIGGSTPETRNVISGNGRHGISIGTLHTVNPDTPNEQTVQGGTGIVVQNNYIGTNLNGGALAAGTSLSSEGADAVNGTAAGNGGDGVFVDAASISNTIKGNTIAHNARNGVHIPNNSNPGVRINIDSNTVYSNTSLGIDLGDSGDTPNDPKDTDGGANHQQNYPTFNSATVGQGGSGPTATITGSLNSIPNNFFVIGFNFGSSCSNATKQFTSKSSPAGSKIVQTDTNGNVTYTHAFPLPAGVTKGYVNATATSLFNNVRANTSELSRCIAVNPPAAPALKFSASAYSVNEGNNTATITVNRTGSTSGTVGVNYATSNGTATAGSDYTAKSGTLSFASNETTKSFTVPIINDNKGGEGNETVRLTLSSPTGGATLGSPSTAVLTIIEPTAFTISGKVFLVGTTTGLGGVTLKLTSPTPAGFPDRVFTTTSTGLYSFANLPAGRAYKVTPAKTGYAFRPFSRSYSDLSANQTGQNFSATKVYSISGRVVRTGTATGIPFVRLTISSPTPTGFATRTVFTDNLGNYSFKNLPAGRNYTIKPSRSGFTFSPATRQFTNLQSDVPVGPSTKFNGTGP